MGDSTELTSAAYLLANEGFQDVILHHDFSIDGSIVVAVPLAGMVFGGLVVSRSRSSVLECCRISFMFSAKGNCDL